MPENTGFQTMYVFGEQDRCMRKHRK